MRFRDSWLARYAVALIAVGVAFFLRQALVRLVGAELPPFITFYPAVMFAALEAGFGPGLVATVTAGLLADYFYFHPQGSFTIASVADAVGLSLFAGTGVCISVIGEFGRRSRRTDGAGERGTAAGEQGGSASREGRMLTVGFVIALITLTAAGWLSFRNLAAEAEADRRTAHTYQVVRKLEVLLSELKDVETGQRGYLITGDEKFLQPYRDSLGKVTTVLAELKSLTSDNEGQRRRLAAIEPLVAEKLAFARTQIEVFHSRGFPAAAALTARGHGKAVMDEIRRRTAEAQTEEERFLQQRLAAKTAAAGMTLQGFLAGNTFGFLLLAAVFFFLKRENTRRTSTEEELLRQRDRLDEAVAERTASLSREIEERSRAEEKLRETAAEMRASGALLRTATDNAAVGLVTLDRQRRYTFANLAYARILELPWTADELIGKGPAEVLPTVYPAEIAPRLDRAFDGERVTYELTKPRAGAAQGETAHYVVVYDPVRGSAGAVDAVIVTIFDITELKRNEEALLESERRFRQVVESLPQLVWTCEPEGPCDYLSPQWVDYTGLPEEKQLGFGWLDQLHPEDRQRTIDHWQVSAGRGDTFAIDFRIRRHDGAYRWFHTLAVPLSDEVGRIVKWFGTNTDIDDLKRAEEALRVSEEKLSLAMRSAGMGVWQLDLRERKRYFDDQVCRCLGIDPARFGGTAEEFYAAVHSDDREMLGAALDRTIGSGEPYEVEYRTVWGDGSAHHVLARGRLVRDAAGQPQRLDGLLWDISDRKRAEERLQASLYEKEVLLKEIHHRVKNNLQVISSLVGLQADGTGNETVREVLREVTFRVRSMSMVHEKLYQSHSLASIEFADYSKGLLNYLWRSYGKAADAVRLTLRLEPVHLPVDIAVPCGLILNELAGNALKHAFRGRGKGEVTVTLHETTEGVVSLSLRDDGVGLPAGLDWRKTRSLGLRLVHMLAGQLRATVEVRGYDGTGFEITFTQPEEKA